MKTLDQLFPQNLTQAIGYTILHSLWQGVFIALTLTLLFIFLHRQSAVIRYRTALGALSFQFLLSGFTFGYYYQAANTAGQFLPNAQIKASFLIQPINQTADFFSWTNISLFFQAQLPFIVTVWVLGLAFMLLRFLGSLAYLQRLRTYKNTPLPAVWQQKVQRLSKNLRLTKPVTAAESGQVKTPLVIGYFKPLILLPLGTLSNLPLNQVEAILAHELAHIRRHDYLINLTQNLIEALFFYHPAIWWVSDFVRVERENCCDDQAIAICGNKMVYARALASLAEMKRPTPNLALALAGKDGSVLGRIKRLFRPATVKPTFTESFVAVAIMLLFLTTISVAAVANFATKKTFSPTQFIDKGAVKKAAQVLNNPSSLISPTDSIGKKKEIILIQDKDGKPISLTIDGVNIPQDQFYKYEKFKLEEAEVGSAVLDGNTTLKGKIIIRKNENTATQAPQKVETVATPRIIEAVKVNAPAPTNKVAPVAETTIVISASRNSSVTTWGHGSEPLYILDGQPINKAEINKINPNAIEKIDVLKGASAGNYGEAGKNGVILITTKAGGAVKSMVSTSQSTKIVIEEKSVNESVTMREGPGEEIPDSNNNSTEPNALTRDHEAKTAKILQELKKDNLYSNDKDYTLKITNSDMYINQVKQPEALYRKYRKYLPYSNQNVTNQTFEINGRFREK